MLSMIFLERKLLFYIQATERVYHMLAVGKLL